MYPYKKILMLARYDPLDVHIPQSVSVFYYRYTVQVCPWADSQEKSYAVQVMLCKILDYYEIGTSFFGLISLRNSDIN